MLYSSMELLSSYQSDVRNKLSGKSALYYAVEKNLPEMLEHMIGLDENDIKSHIDRATYIHGIAPIHIAAKEGYLNCLTKLIKLSANINATTAKQQTPLHLAVQNQHLSIVLALLKAGASPNLINEDGETPLDIALKAKTHTFIRTLKSFAAKTAEQLQNELPLNRIRKEDIVLATVVNKEKAMVKPFAYSNYDDVFEAIEVVLATVVEKSKKRKKSDSVETPSQSFLNQHPRKRIKLDIPNERYISQRGREFGEFCFGQLMQELLKFSEFSRKTTQRCHFSRKKVVKMIEDQKEWPEYKEAALSHYDKMLDELLPAKQCKLQSKC